MKKTIEIKHRDGQCSICPFNNDCGTTCYFEYDGYKRVPNKDCPGPGKFRMTLEKIDEFDCPRCESVQEYHICGIYHKGDEHKTEIICHNCNFKYQKINDEPYQLIQEKQEFIIE